MMRLRAVSLTLGMFALLFSLCLTGCSGSARSNGPRTYSFDFRSSTEGWTEGFTDLPINYRQDMFELGFAHADLPANLSPAKKALLISGHNRSDDLFMFVKRQVDGLEANTTYRIDFDIEIASNAPSSFAGIGGGPGVAVRVKAGASAQEPLAVPQRDYLRLNLDKDSMSPDGRDLIFLGDIGIPGEQAVYQFKRLDNRNKPFSARTDSQGKLYLIVGTDSGFEGKTNLYYSQIRVTLTPSPG